MDHLQAAQWGQDIMRQSFSRTMLFLTFIKGPNVQEWASSQVGWLGSQIIAGAGRNEEHLYDTVMDSFKTAFTDTMSLQRQKLSSVPLKWKEVNLTHILPSLKDLLEWRATTSKTKWYLTDSAAA